MRTTRMLWVLGILIAGTMLLLAACGDDDGDGGEPTTEPDATESVDGAEVPGISDTEIVLGTHTSLTGPIAAYSIIPRFASAYFEYINETEGGVNGRLITYLIEDDQYSPPLAVDLTRKLVEQDGIFALFNALGTPNHLQVIDYLQDQGVPDMFVATGAIEWVRDPAARPFTFGSNPNYTGEGLVMGKYITDNFAGGKYGVILQNDDFGIDGLAGVKLGVNDTVELVGEEPYEVTDPDLNSQVDRLRAADADVVVIFSTPLLMGNAIRHARQDLNWDVPFIISSVSMNELTGLIAGDAIEGTIGPVATFMQWQEDHPGIRRHLEILEFAGEDRAGASVLTLYSQYVAEMMVETLRRAGDNPTRDSLIEAAESLKDWTCSVCLYSVTLGPDDHDPAQTFALAEFRGGRIEITGPAYSYEGVSVADLSVDSLVEVDLPEGAQP